jgi:hypothetical protein
MGSRGIYHDGWMASAFGPRAPWVPGLPEGILEWTPDKDKWELYDQTKDWSQADDLADKMPAKLADLKERFLVQLTENKGPGWLGPASPDLLISLYFRSDQEAPPPCHRRDPRLSRPRPHPAGPASAQGRIR